jgi:hypothetical protein
LNHKASDCDHDPSITTRDIFHYIFTPFPAPSRLPRALRSNLRRELPRIPFAAFSTDCHPERSEGPMQLAGGTGAADKSIGPSARKKRGPQDDNARIVSGNTADPPLRKPNLHIRPVVQMDAFDESHSARL